MDQKEMEINRLSAKQIRLTNKKADTEANMERKYAELCVERDKLLADVAAELQENNGTLMFLKTKLDEVKKKALEPISIASRAEAQFKTSGRNTPAPSTSTSPKPPPPYCGPGVTQTKRQWLASIPSSRLLTSSPRASVSSRPSTPPVFDVDTDDIIGNVQYDDQPASTTTTKKAPKPTAKKSYPPQGKRTSTFPKNLTKRTRTEPKK